MKLLTAFFSLLLIATVSPALAADTPPMVTSFDGQSFVHRWSKNNQNEFTPEKQADLDKWEEMITVNLYPNVTNGDQLAALANGILASYQKNGKIIRTDSKPLTQQAEAEHLLVAILGAPGVIETAFARVMLVDGVGISVIYARRGYGEKAAETIGGWLQSHGPAKEGQLMAWKNFPRPASLTALPQSN
jgi:hypothetical protein